MRYIFLAFMTVCTVCIGNAAVADEPDVELEVLVSPDAPLDASHEWLEVLKNQPFDRIRFRSRRASDSGPSIRGRRPNSGRIEVTALLTPDNRLAVPGRTFRMQDSARIAEWLSNQRQQLDTDPEAAGKASAKQLLGLRQRMSDPISDSTNGIDVKEFLREAGREWDVPISVSPDLRNRLSGPLDVELAGLTRGTGLAIAVRSFGGLVVPGPDGASLVVSPDTPETAGSPTWPIGWQPRKPVPILVPKFVDSLNITVEDQPFEVVVGALQAKIGIPFVFDHDQIKRQGIDLDKIKVNIRPKQAMYKKVLDSILVRNFLSGEVRVDEAGTPFYWITTLQRENK